MADYKCGCKALPLSKFGSKLVAELKGRSRVPCNNMKVQYALLNKALFSFA